MLSLPHASAAKGLVSRTDGASERNSFLISWKSFLKDCKCGKIFIMEEKRRGVAGGGVFHFICCFFKEKENCGFKINVQVR